MTAHRPAHAEPRVQVDDGSEVELRARRRQHLCRVADPALVRRRRRELATEHVGRDRLVVVAVGRELEPLAHTRLESFLLHDADDPIAADLLAFVLDEVTQHARRAVRAAALVEGHH